MKFVFLTFLVEDLNLLFWSIFGEIHSRTRELFFLDIKVTISETSTEILRKFCFFYHVWKGANPEENRTEENLDLFKQCLSVVLKLFWNSLRPFLFRHKSDYLRNEHWNTRKVCFSYHVWKGEIPEENLDLFKQLFLIKPVKADKY